MLPFEVLDLLLRSRTSPLQILLLFPWHLHLVSRRDRELQLGEPVVLASQCLVRVREYMDMISLLIAKQIEEDKLLARVAHLAQVLVLVAGITMDEDQRGYC